MGRFSGDKAVQGGAPRPRRSPHPSACAHKGCLSAGEAEEGDAAFRGRPRGRLTTGKAEDGDIAFRGRSRGRLAAGEAIEMSFDVRLVGSNSYKAAVKSAAGTGKPMPESEPESLFTSIRTIPLIGQVAGAGACAGYISIQGGGGKRGRRGRC